MSAANLMVAITSVMVLAAVGGIGLDQAGVIDLTGDEEDPEEPPADDTEDETEDETTDPEDESETEETGGEEEEEPSDPGEDETQDPTETENGEDETDEDEEEDTEYQDGEMHVSLDEDPVANEFITATYTEGGDPVQDVEITLEDELGITNEDGKAVLQVPEQEEATLQTDTGFETTLDIEVVEEPEGEVGQATIGVQNPEDQAEFETTPGDPVQIDFEVTVDSEVQGELKFLVEGEEIDSETVDEGISTVEFSKPLTEGSYEWSLEFEFEEDSETVGPYSLEVVEVEPDDDLSLLSDPVSGEHSTVSLYEDGSAVEGEEIFVNGDSIGETGSTGTVSFEVPFEEEITISTASEGFEDANFDVEISHDEPEITLLSPEDGASFETLEGETTEIEFNYEVETTEDSGTVELQIDGEEYAQTLEQGENSGTETLSIGEGSYEWELVVSTDEHTKTSDSRSLEIEGIEPQHGLSLHSDPVADEWNTVVLYEEDQPVEGETLYLNGDSIGETDEFGELDFEVPNVEGITISTDLSGIEDLSESVDGYEGVPVEFNLMQPDSGEVIEDYRVDVAASVKSLEDFDQEIQYEIKINETTVEESIVEAGETEEYNSLEYVEDAGYHELQIEAEDQEGNSYESEERPFETTEDKEPITMDIESPVDGEVIEGYRTDILHNLESPYDYHVEMSVGDRKIIDDEFNAGYAPEDPINRGFDTGSHELSLTAENLETGTVYEADDVSFETTDEPPIADFFLNYPTDDYPPPGGCLEAPNTINFEFDVEGFQEGEWMLVVDEDVVASGQKEDAPEYTQVDHDEVLEEGDYEWFVEYETEEGATTVSETRTIEVGC